MEGEYANSSENREKSGDHSWINRIVHVQPEAVQEAYKLALTAAIRETYLQQKEGLSSSVYLEGAKSKFLNEYERALLDLEKSGLVPDGFNKSFFELNLKVWIAFATEQQLLKASLDYINEKKKKSYSFEWHPNSDYLLQLAKALHKSDHITRKAFFLGNERAKLFRPNEIDEITREIEKLDSK